ncbi:unnamed protein product [Closterium sp. NIES-64]|nr:unnamed protein product [Closterium sp. NIES-64]
MGGSVTEAVVWQCLAEAYLTGGRAADADLCVAKCQTLDPYSADTWMVAAMLEDARSCPQEALACYRVALSTNQSLRPSLPTHQHSHVLSLPHSPAMLEDARSCPQEALACYCSALAINCSFHPSLPTPTSSLSHPHSHMIIHIPTLPSSPILSHPLPLTPTGMLEEARGCPEEALACYRSALAIDQWHAASKARLGALLLQMGGEWLHMAQVYLREVVSGDGFDARAWHVLGLVERGRGDVGAAAECFRRAMEAEETAPAVPFNTLRPILPQLLL